MIYESDFKISKDRDEFHFEIKKSLSEIFFEKYDSDNDEHSSIGS